VPLATELERNSRKSRGQIGENGDSAAQIVEFRATTFGKTFATNGHAHICK
jgi:hypothetical protein